MKTLFIIATAFIILTTWFFYEMFVLYGTFMGAIANPDCPETECFCPKVVLPSKDTKDNEFSFQNCRYEIMCSDYQEACPKTYEQELEVCKKELEELK